MLLSEPHMVDICILVTKNIKLINSNLFKFLSNKFMISIFLSYPSIYQILIANGNDFSVQKGSLIPANLRRLAMAMANQGFFSATRKGRIQGFLGRGGGGNGVQTVRLKYVNRNVNQCVICILSKSASIEIVDARCRSSSSFVLILPEFPAIHRHLFLLLATRELWRRF